MNREIESLYDWLCANRLSINVVNTEFLLLRNNLDNNNFQSFHWIKHLKLRVAVIKLIERNKNFNFILRLNKKALPEYRFIKYLCILIDNELN